MAFVAGARFPAEIPNLAPSDWLVWATGPEGAQSSDVECAFQVRNLLIDEGVAVWRGDSYCGYLRTSPDIAPRSIDWNADSSAVATWRKRHSAYFYDQVAREATDTGFPKVFDPGDATVCPETFQKVPDDSPFLNTNLNLELIRVERLSTIAGLAGEEESELRRAIRAYLDSHDASAEIDLRGVFDGLTIKRDGRPAFAAFYADLESVFEPSNSNWPDDVRDALGLYHYNPLPPLVEVEVLVFRYPIKEVPRFKNDTNRRPLIPPTVLDSQPSPSFFPSPSPSITGHTIHLGLNVPPLMREVLHPPVAYRPEHLFRFGSIRRSVSVAKLKEGREWHLLVVRSESGRPDYAMITDP